ncbi:MAG: T9SS type A sorting domain-containing protein [Sphingobacteriales bacterium]|nr:MAG: T9SS type A sorting domain-containing protein [Sphingobacteriales bacterium]
MRYTARFYCINDNATPLYIVVGDDNKLSSTGVFDGSAQPFLFQPGITRFNVPFSGTSLKWELKTYNSTLKTATSSTASSTSNRCGSGRLDVTVLPGMGGEVGEVWTAYPNPSTNTVRFTTGHLSGKGFMIYSSVGKQYVVPITNLNSDQFELDISSLPVGMYYIRFKEEGRTIKFIKQ